MKRKLLLICVALLCTVGSWAQTDVTANYVGDISHIINGGGHSCGNKHKQSDAKYSESNGDGWWNTQTLSGWHAFTAPNSSGGTGESWTSGFGSAGVMMGRTMALPAGNYTLSFEAFGCNATNSADPGTLPSAGDAVAFLTSNDNIDITNIASAGDNTFHNVSFTFDVTLANSVYEFGIKKLTDGSKIDWCQIKNVSLVLNSPNLTPIANNSNGDWSGEPVVNNQSIEGNSDGTNFLAPFLQKWIASGSTLGNGTCQNSYTPSESGFYRVNAWVRLIKESGGQTTYSGATMFAGTNSVNVCSGGTLYNSNKVHLGTYSAKIDATKDVAFNYGFTLSGANFNWLSFKNITIEKITLDEFAETFSSGSAVTAGTWYKFTTGNSSDAYTLSSSGNATITYTTDGTLADDAGISTTWTLHAKRNAVLAPNTTYYIKSDAAVTLTKAETPVNSSYVSGWTKVTSISELQDSPEDYFFAIFSANNTGLILKNRTNANDEKPSYATAANPLSSTEYLYEIENYDGQFALKSVLSGKYYENRSTNDQRGGIGSDGPWNYHADLATKDANCKTTLNWVNNAFVIQTANKEGENNYLGLWYADNNHSGYVNNEILAGNKPEIAKGSFIIYRIAKSNINLTGRITNPDFGNATWSTGWSGTGSNKATAFVKQSNNPSFSGNFAEMWVRNTTMSAGNIYQTLSKLPAGVYTLSAKVQAGIPCKLYARIDTDEQYIECNSSAKIETLTFLVSETSDVTIGLKHDGVASASGDVWVAVDDFALTYVEPLADSDDYDALNLAIEAANAKTLGFEVSEYAPYNNVDAISKLASAKAINQSAVNAKSTITSATGTLEGATWTANPEKLNAFYDGNFAIQQTKNESDGNTKGTSVTGWDNAVGLRQIVTSSVENSPLYNQYGIFVWGSATVTYGNTLGYTMPLGANKIYRASYRRMSWEGNSNGHGQIEIKNSKNETVAFFGTVTTTGEYNYAGDYNVADASSVTEAIYFVTGEEADTYTATLCPWSNAVFTDVELISVDALPLSESSTVYYSAGTYPSVTLDRTFASTDRWYTLCAPFAFSKDKFEEVKVLNAVVGEGESAHMKFVDAGATVAAGMPCLVKPASANATLTATGVAMNPATTAQTVTVDGINYIGTFSQVNLTASDSNAWVVSNNNLYNVDSDVTVGAYRAYFTVGAGSGVKALSFDFGDATGINTITNSQQSMANGPIYNLAGQKMSKFQKGVNIVNGKKVLVK